MDLLGFEPTNLPLSLWSASSGPCSFCSIPTVDSWLSPSILGVRIVSALLFGVYLRVPDFLETPI